MVASVLVILGLVGGAWWWHDRETGQVRDTLTLYGNVDIRQVEVGFRVGGRIAGMAVEEGQQVQQGDTLAHLDPKPQEDALRRAVAERAMQEAELAKMLAGYREEDVAQARSALVGAQAVLVNTSANLKRILTLRRQRAVAQRDLDEAQAAQTEALSRRNAAHDQLRLMESGFRIEDVTRQRAAVQAAQAQEALARTNLDDTTLYAPQDGVVLTRVHETGAVVQPGQTVYTVTLTHPAWIRAYVTQPHLGDIRPGQAVLLSIDATPGTSYPGTIGFISPTAEFTPKTVETKEVRNDLVFRFRVITADSQNVMRQGMPVTVTLRKDGGQP
ncbi:MAG: secretion protein HlyD [Bilophila sp.]